MRYNWNLGDAVVISSLFEVSVVWASFWFELGFFSPSWSFQTPFQFWYIACLIRRIPDERILPSEKHNGFLAIRTILNPDGN